MSDPFKNGGRVAIEIAVSKPTLNGRDGYIICVRDITPIPLDETGLSIVKLS